MKAADQSNYASSKKSELYKKVTFERLKAQGQQV